VAEVGVHLDDHGRAAAEGSTKAIEVGSPKTLFGGSMEDLDPRIVGSKRVCEASGPVRRIVVDDEEDGGW
jgi:hypothetical protein